MRYTMTAKGTGKKVKLSVTIDRDILDRIDKECAGTGVSRSYKIESYIKKGMVVKELEAQVSAIRKRLRIMRPPDTKPLDNTQELQ